MDRSNFILPVLEKELCEKSLGNNTSVEIDLPSIAKHDLLSETSKQYALFLLVLQCKYLTPTSTIHKISKEISGLLTNYQLELKTAIQNLFSSTQHLTPDAINSIKSIIKSTSDTDELFSYSTIIAGIRIAFSFL